MRVVALLMAVSAMAFGAQAVRADAASVSARNDACLKAGGGWKACADAGLAECVAASPVADLGLGCAESELAGWTTLAEALWQSTPRDDASDAADAAFRRSLEADCGVATDARLPRAVSLVQSVHCRRERTAARAAALMGVQP